jgi:hypothetical protein
VWSELKLRLQQRFVQRVLAWAANAPRPESLTPHLSRVWQDLYEDWQNKSQQITQLELDAGILAILTTAGSSNDNGEIHEPGFFVAR